MRGFKTAVIDFDVGLRNLDLIMGCERRVVYDLINVVNGEATLNQALIGTSTATTCSCCPPRKRATRMRCPKKASRRCSGSDHMGFDYIVCDSPAGIGMVP